MKLVARGTRFRGPDDMSGVYQPRPKGKHARDVVPITLKTASSSEEELKKAAQMFKLVPAPEVAVSIEEPKLPRPYAFCGRLVYGVTLSVVLVTGVVFSCVLLMVILGLLSQAFGIDY